MQIVCRALGAAMLFLALAAVPTMASVTDDWPIRSGLPWRSGVGNSFQGFEQWRGRPLDVYVLWHPHRTWEDIRQANKSLLTGVLRGKPGRVSMGLAMLPSTNPGQFAECAHGDFDDNYRTVASKLVQWERGNAILRIGWEANGGRSGDGIKGGGFPWGIQGDVDDYVACFRHIVEVVRAVSPDFVIEWTMKKASELENDRSIEDAWPGDKYVDLVGIDYYDGYPAYDSDSAWNADFKSLEHKGPRGLGAWLDFAKRHHKKLAIPEWGVRNKPKVAGDNPRYIQRMFEFFRDNAGEIAYEAYFNPHGPTAKIFSLYPPELNPQSAAKYRELYSKG